MSQLLHICNNKKAYPNSQENSIAYEDQCENLSTSKARKTHHRHRHGAEVGLGFWGFSLLCTMGLEVLVKPEDSQV
jgi:hypothetical protein